MKSPIPERRRTLLAAGGRALAVACLAGLVAGAAAAVESPASAKSELIPTGARATIYLDVPDSAEDTVRHLRMEQGKSAFVRTSYGVRRVSVGDPKIADVIVLRQSELQIVARGVGTTNIVIWSNSGEIEAAIDLHVGRAYSSIESEINRVLGTSEVRVESAGNAIVLTGSVPDAGSLERVLRVAHAYFPEKEEAQIVNLVTVGGNQQVMLEITVNRGGLREHPVRNADRRTAPADDERARSTGQQHRPIVHPTRSPVAACAPHSAHCDHEPDEDRERQAEPGGHRHPLRRDGVRIRGGRLLSGAGGHDVAQQIRQCDSR
jgi:hypothetical protein